MFACGAGGSEGVFVLAQAVAQDRARILADGESDPLAARAGLAHGPSGSGSLVSRGRPRHAPRINAPYGAELIPVASSTDSVSATAEAAAERSPQNTSTGVRALSASTSSPSVPSSRAISTLCCDKTYALSSSHISRATTHPCHNQRSLSVAEASAPASLRTAFRQSGTAAS